jgi:arylsulfatase A-like enzyme
LRFIHLNGAHAPYTLDENGNSVSSQDGTAIDQYVGCMRLVFYYIQMLQDIGMYDNSTIIITADHGENYVTEELEQNTNPILFIKPKAQIVTMIW